MAPSDPLGPVGLMLSAGPYNRLGPISRVSSILLPRKLNLSIARTVLPLMANGEYDCHVFEHIVSVHGQVSAPSP